MNRTRTEDDPRTAAAAAVPAWACLLVGVAAALVGLAPWLVTGARLLVQNLWATDATSETMPRVLLPFSQYTITLIIGVLVTGAALAGLWSRAMGRRLPRLGPVAVAVGVVVVQVVALGQTAWTVRRGLREGVESTVYLAALEGVALLSMLVGVLALVLVARAPRGGAVLGLAVGALALAPWLSGLVSPVGSTSPVPSAVGLAVPWVGPVLVGAAIGWAGVRTTGRVLVAVLALVLVWVVPPLTTAIMGSAGSRVLAHDVREMAAYAVQVFVAAATTPALVLPPVGVALVVAAVTGVVLGRRRADREQ